MNKKTVKFTGPDSVLYVGKLPNGAYGIAIQNLYTQNIYRKLKKSKARLREEW